MPSPIKNLFDAEIAIRDLQDEVVRLKKQTAKSASWENDLADVRKMIVMATKRTTTLDFNDVFRGGAAHALGYVPDPGPYIGGGDRVLTPSGGWGPILENLIGAVPAGTGGASLDQRVINVMASLAVIGGISADSLWVRNLNVLGGGIPDCVKTLLKGFAFSTGQGNAAGGADFQLSSYDVLIPANFLSQPGDAVVAEGTLSILANAEAKTLKMQIASGTLRTVWSSSANVANHIVPFRFLIRRRTSTTGSIVGYDLTGAADQGTPTPFLVSNTLGAVDWTIDQTLKIFASGNTINDVTLTDYFVDSKRSAVGAVV